VRKKSEHQFEGTEIINGTNLCILPENNLMQQNLSRPKNATATFSLSRRNPMTQKCLIKLNNGAVTVVDFGGKLIQLPPVRTTEKYINVSYENGVYALVKEPTSEKPEVEIENNEFISAEEPINLEQESKNEEPVRIKPLTKKTIKKNKKEKNTKEGLYSSYAKG
jgi:hypothetical protein